MVEHRTPPLDRLRTILRLANDLNTFAAFEEDAESGPDQPLVVGQQYSNIVGHRRLAKGILHNVLYLGIVRWSRSQWRRRPDTEAYTYRVRPKDDWIERIDESLRVVPQTLWDKVQTRMAMVRTGGIKRTPAARYLLSGVLYTPSTIAPLLEAVRQNLLDRAKQHGALSATTAGRSRRSTVRWPTSKRRYCGGMRRTLFFRCWKRKPPSAPGWSQIMWLGIIKDLRTALERAPLPRDVMRELLAIG
jgi:hypothetical protein